MITNNASLLYSERPLKEVLKKLQEGSELEVIVDFLRALQGNIIAIGRMGNQLLFHNNSGICSVLVSLSTGKVDFDFNEDEGMRIQLKRKFELDIYRLFERVMPFISGSESMQRFFMQLKIPLVLYALMSMDMETINRVFSFTREVTRPP